MPASYCVSRVSSATDCTFTFVVIAVPLQEQQHHIPTGYQVRAKPILDGLHHEYRLEKIAA